MEQPAIAEDKITSFESRFDDIYNAPAPPGVTIPEADGPLPSVQPQQSTGEDDLFVVAPAFKPGKIAALKQELSDKGLDLQAKVAAAAGAVAEASADTVAAASRRETGASDIEHAAAQFNFSTPISLASRSVEPGASDHEPIGTAMSRPEFEKGKIESMKKALVARGLDIDPEVAAALAAGAAFAAQERVENDGSNQLMGAEFERGKINAMKDRLIAEGLDIHAAAAAAAAAVAAEGLASSPVDGFGAAMQTMTNTMISNPTNSADEVGIESETIMTDESEVLEAQKIVRETATASFIDDSEKADTETVVGASEALEARSASEFPEKAVGHLADGTSRANVLAETREANGTDDARASGESRDAPDDVSVEEDRSVLHSNQVGLEAQTGGSENATQPPSPAVDNGESAAPPLNGDGSDSGNVVEKNSSVTEGRTAGAAASGASIPGQAIHEEHAGRQAKASSMDPGSAVAAKKDLAKVVTPARARLGGTTSGGPKARPREQKPSTTTTAPPGQRLSTPDRKAAKNPSPLPRQTSSSQAQRRPQLTGQDGQGSAMSTRPRVSGRALTVPPSNSQETGTPQRTQHQTPQGRQKASAVLAEARRRRLSTSPANSTDNEQRPRPDASQVRTPGTLSRSSQSTPVEQRATPSTGRVSRTHPSTPTYATSESPVGVERPLVRHSPGSAMQQGSSPAVASAQAQPMVTPVRLVRGGSPAMVMTPSSAEEVGRRLHDQARETRERLERRRREGTARVGANGLSPFTPRRLANPRLGNPSVGGMERVERLYRDATERESKLERARRMEEEHPRDCTFTPKISSRASSRGRSERRRQRSGENGSDVDPSNEGSGGRGRGMSRFQALYQDAKVRRAKLEERTDARIAEVAGPGSPSITARGRNRSKEPLDVRLRENADRWNRRWKELEEKKVEQEREGCTFKPDFPTGRSASAPRLRGRNQGNDGESSSGKPFYLRAEKYLAAKEVKLAQLKREFEERERAEVTFRPNVSPSLRPEGSEGPGSGETGGSSEHRHRRKSSKGSPSGAGGDSVFVRLARKATEQEQHKAALKEAYIKQEREEFHGFQPRLPARSVDTGPAKPLQARLRESTAHWAQSREARERRRIELEAEECTFRPSIGSGGDYDRGGVSMGTDTYHMRRSSSAEPRTRSNASRGSGGVGSEGGMNARSFEARTRAFQEAREERLHKLREEKQRQELEEATFQPTIGFGNSVRNSNGNGNCVSGSQGHGSSGIGQGEDGLGSESFRRSSQGATRPATLFPRTYEEYDAQRKELRFKAASESMGFKMGSSDDARDQEVPPLPPTTGEDGVVANLQQALDNARRKRDRLLEEANTEGGGGRAIPPPPAAGIESAGAAAGEEDFMVAPGLVDPEGTVDGINLDVGDGAVSESKEESGARDAVRFHGNDAARGLEGQGMDVDELSARLQRLAEDPDSGDPTVSSQNLEAEQQQQQGIVAPVSVASHVASAMPRPLTFDTRGNAGTALSMPPRALRSEVGPHVPAAPIVIEDDECEGKGGQEVEEGEHELEEMNAHHGGRIVDAENDSRASPGAEDSEAESAADTENGLEREPADGAGNTGAVEEHDVRHRVENDGDGDNEVQGNGGVYGNFQTDRANGGDQHEIAIPDGECHEDFHDYGALRYDDYEEGDSDDDEDIIGKFTSDAIQGRPKTKLSSRSRTLEDFEQCSREIVAKLQNL